MLVRLRGQRGDTIIEVLLAVTVFSMVAVGSLAIMNQGTSTAQRALEITLVRQQMDAQADTIRYIHRAYLADRRSDNDAMGEWNKMTEPEYFARSAASDFGDTNGKLCPADLPSNSFIVNAHTARVAGEKPQSISTTKAGATPPPFSQVRYSDDGVLQDAYGIWVEAVPTAKDKAGGVAYVDFHIRSCWESPGSGSAMTLGTIVRLYEPK